MNEYDPCRALWCAVLLQALREEITGEMPHAVQGYPDRHWTKTKDFAMVCNLAGLDPRAVRDRVPYIDPNKLVWSPKVQARREDGE